MTRVLLVSLALWLVGCVPTREERWAFKAPGGHWGSYTPYYIIGGGQDYRVPVERGLEVSTDVRTSNHHAQLYIAVHSDDASWKVRDSALQISAGGLMVRVAATRQQDIKGGVAYWFDVPGKGVSVFALESATLTDSMRDVSVPRIQYEYHSKWVMPCFCQ